MHASVWWAPQQGWRAKQETACRQSLIKNRLCASARMCLCVTGSVTPVSSVQFKVRRACFLSVPSFALLSPLNRLWPMQGSGRAFSLGGGWGSSHSLSWNAVDFLNPHQSILGLWGRAYLKPPFSKRATSGISKQAVGWVSQTHFLFHGHWARWSQKCNGRRNCRRRQRLHTRGR